MKDSDIEELLPSTSSSPKSSSLKHSSSVTSFKVSMYRDGEVKTCNVPCLAMCDEQCMARFCLELKHAYDHILVILFHVFYLFYIATTVFRNVAYKHHRPDNTLWDLGYEMLPETSFARWLSEYVLGANIVVTVLFSMFTPIFSSRPHSKGMGTTKMAIQMLTMLSIGHTLRFFTYVVFFFFYFIIFLSPLYTALSLYVFIYYYQSSSTITENRYSVTGLPGPAAHCRPGEPDSTFHGNIWTDVGGPGMLFLSFLSIFQNFFLFWFFSFFCVHPLTTSHTHTPGKHNCGDLVFSGHMLQVFVFTMSMHHHRHAYFERPFLRIGLTWFLWLTLVVQAICIIMARNHYTVDIIVACYVCPMLYYTLQNIYESPTFKRIYPSYMGNFEYKHESAQHCSERFQNLPFVKCLTRLGSFVSRKLGFSVRILFLLSLDS